MNPHHKFQTTQTPVKPKKYPQEEAAVQSRISDLLICWEIGQYISLKLPESSGKLKSLIVPTLSAQSENTERESENKFMPTVSALSPIPDFLTLITWSQHCEIMNSCKLPEEYIFYILYAFKERLNARELRRAIKTNCYSHLFFGLETHSAGLKKIYPTAEYLFKDVACLDFLGLPERHKEKRLQKDILTNMKNFILELGKDFLFLGQEYPIQVGGKTFKIDLLFYHRGLQCLVAVELKTTEFDPSFMGQLEFYLEALDQDVKRSNENPSIGILLCKEANREIVKYALNRSMSPTMIAKYERELIPRAALQRSLSDFCNFIKK
jgi:predicted nuclease of restriction endonuclease-like (RecB) superfamily